MAPERVSGLDELRYEVVITDDVTGIPVTTGTVKMRLCQVETITPLLEGGGASEVTLTHAGAGRWVGTHTAAGVAEAITSIALNGLFDRVAIVEGRGARRVSRCRKVRVVAGG